jgi:hypothetical protein
MFGYRQVPIEPTDVWKTSLKYKEGLFEWLIVPFGLKNASTTFNNILMFNITWEDHMQHIQ